MTDPDKIDSWKELALAVCDYRDRTDEISAGTVACVPVEKYFTDEFADEFREAAKERDEE